RAGSASTRRRSLGCSTSPCVTPRPARRCVREAREKAVHHRQGGMNVGREPAIIGSIIIGSIIVAAAILIAGRWEAVTSPGALFWLDKWTGKINACDVHRV